ncbi:MAG TPA: hypothetical protein VII53_10885 [Solirubrobacteraceae bacterium]
MTILPATTAILLAIPILLATPDHARAGRVRACHAHTGRVRG